MTTRALPDPATEPTITAKRWAEVLGVSTRAVHYAVERGEIPSIRVGRRVVIPTARALAASGLTPDQQELVRSGGRENRVIGAVLAQVNAAPSDSESGAAGAPVPRMVRPR